LELGEVGTEIVVLLLELVQLVLSVLYTVRVAKGSFQVGEHVWVVGELGESIRDLRQHQLVCLPSQPAGNVCQTALGGQESIGIGDHLAVDLLCEASKVCARSIKLLWVWEFFTEDGRSGT
jgi:hypothetical protein